jgi:hypothetical protein
MTDARTHPRRGRGRPNEPFHLFAYGTLTNPNVFHGVLGLRLVFDPAQVDEETSVLAREAVLGGYRKASPDQTYLYAVPDPQGRIRGYVIGPLAAESLPALRRYEGRNYRQIRKKVQTADGPVRAVVFVGNLKQLGHTFGYEFHDHYKQEVLLQDKIEKALLEDETSRLHTDEELTRAALWQLHGRTIRDLYRHHFDGGGISNFAIRQAIRDEPLPDFDSVAGQPEVRRLAPNYLTLMLRQVLFNLTEGQLRDQFRYELDQMNIPQQFYDRTISALATFRVLNGQSPLLHLLAGDMLDDIPFGSARLIDYVRWAVEAARQVYDPVRIRRALRDIRLHMGGGHIPLGTELEFSNSGHAVIADPSGRTRPDAQYDGFFYFRDFGLDVLTWKLGGHLDDHYVKSSPKRRRGFFELAFGSLSVEAGISKPITNDPWVLNQIIQEALRFYDVAPHSLHVSLQLRYNRPPGRDRAMPLSAMKCLFALAGDPGLGDDGRLRIRRLCSEEILRKEPKVHMLFSEISQRRSRDEDEHVPAARAGQWVQQFKFLRLSPRINYEPIVVALKGLQLHYRPGTFLTAGQLAERPALAHRLSALRKWGCDPEPLGRQEIDRFLKAVEQGLLREKRGRPAHSLAYIAYCLSHLQAELQRFNERVG